MTVCAWPEHALLYEGIPRYPLLQNCYTEGGRDPRVTLPEQDTRGVSSNYRGNHSVPSRWSRQTKHAPLSLPIPAGQLVLQLSPAATISLLLPSIELDVRKVLTITLGSETRAWLDLLLLLGLHLCHIQPSLLDSVTVSAVWLAPPIYIQKIIGLNLVLETTHPEVFLSCINPSGKYNDNTLKMPRQLPSTSFLVNK
jgi:hypothetical protein